MSISQRLRDALRVSLADPGASAEAESILGADSGLAQNLGTSDTPTFAGLKIGANQVLHGRQTKVTPVAVTFTASGTPTVYTTPSGALTVADSAVPTVVELLAYCDELRGNIAGLQAILTAHGLTN